jgi:ubiquinone/menaquinone biosynthesis C-methylase UbiE
MNERANLFTDGEAYERLMGQWSRPAGAQFLDWLGLPNGLRWLDVGCGNGAFTEVLLARGAPSEVIGIDPSQEQLAYARTRAGVAKALFQQGSAMALPFDDASFDVAAMALVITFVPDPQQAVAEMVRVVRPGGMVASYMWDVPGGGLPVEPIHAAMHSLGFPQVLPPGVAVSRLDAMLALWERAGLQAIDSRVIRIPVAYSGFDEFWQSNSVPVGPVGKAINAMAPEARDKLKARLREQLPTGADGRIAYEAFANAVQGKVPG